MNLDSMLEIEIRVKKIELILMNFSLFMSFDLCHLLLLLLHCFIVCAIFIVNLMFYYVI